MVFNLNQKVSVTSGPTRQQGGTTQNPRWGGVSEGQASAAVWAVE